MFGARLMKTLLAMIRANNLAIADNAMFRDEPLSFIVGAGDDAEAEKMRGEIEGLRASGELAIIIDSMKLE
jgi:ABC-type amino acid transport substrate-binding protein